MNEFVDFHKMCRLCATATGILGRKSLDIFGEEGRAKSLCQKIQSCLQMAIAENDPLPNTLCCSCVCTLDFLDSFRDKCHDSQRILVYSYQLLSGAIPPDSIFQQCDVELHMVPYEGILKTQSTRQDTAANGKCVLNGEAEEEDAENNKDQNCCDAQDTMLLNITEVSGNVSGWDDVSGEGAEFEDSDFDKNANNVRRGEHAHYVTSDFQTTHENSVKKVASFTIDEHLEMQKNSEIIIEYLEQSQEEVFHDTTTETAMNIQGETKNWEMDRNLFSEFAEVDGRKGNTTKKRVHSGEEEHDKKMVKFDSDSLPCVKSESPSHPEQLSACTEPEFSVELNTMDQKDPLKIPLHGAVKCCNQASPFSFSPHLRNFRRARSRAEATVTQRCTSSEGDFSSVERIHKKIVETESECHFGGSSVNNGIDRISSPTENAVNKSDAVEKVGRMIIHDNGAIDMTPQTVEISRLKNVIPDVRYGATCSGKDSGKKIGRNTCLRKVVDGDDDDDIIEVSVGCDRENFSRHSKSISNCGIKEIDLGSSQVSEIVLDEAFAKQSQVKSTKNEKGCNQEIQEVEQVLRNSPSVVSHVSLKGANYMCEICKEVFILKDDYMYHMRGHNVMDPVTCDICNKLFFSGNKLKEHRKIHDDVNLYQCKECGKSYMHEIGLMKHMKLHSGEKTLKCDSCGKSFTFSTSLLLHRASSKCCRLSL